LRLFALIIVPIGIGIVTYATGAVTSMMIVAIRRGRQIISNPGPDEQLYGDDVVIVLGAKEQLALFEKEAVL
jgi:K+/H+ antiporter YhaU regulatory subunit KhtT